MKTTIPSKSELYKRFGYWCEVDQKLANKQEDYEPIFRRGQEDRKLDKVFVVPENLIPSTANKKNLKASDFVTVYHRTKKNRKQEINQYYHKKHYDKDKKVSNCYNESEHKSCKIDLDGYILVNNFFIENVPAVMLKENRIKCIDPDPELATKLYDANKSMYVDRLGNRIFRKYNCDSHNEKLRGVPEYD